MTLNPQTPWKPSRTERYVTVRSGILWITRNGRVEDWIVGAGTTLELNGTGWILEALGGTPCDFITSTSSPTSPTRATPSRFSSKKAG